MPRTATTLKPGEQRGGIRKGQRHVKSIIKKELGVTVEDQMKTLGLFIKGAGAVRLIRQMQTLHGFRYVMAWQIVAEYIMPKLQRIQLDDDRPQTPTIINILNVMQPEQKMQLLELLRTANVNEALQNSEPINNTSNIVNDTDSVYECIPNEQQSTDSDRVGEELNNHDNVAT
jgi:hypothetical protein